MENKKVINATECSYDGIDFKSKLEVACYIALKEAGFEPEYEKHTYKVSETKLYPTPNYTVYRDRKLHKDVWGRNPYKVLGVRFTPDFVFTIGDKTIIVEAKGYSNETYSYRKKLFFKWLEDNCPNSAFFEVHNKKQLKAAIEVIKTIDNDREIN